MSVSTNIEKQLDKSTFFKFDSIGGFLQNLTEAALALGSVASLVWVFWGGVEYLTAGGNQEQTKNAKAKISQAIFGLAALASIWAIWRLITYFLGLSSSLQGPIQFKIPKP